MTCPSCGAPLRLREDGDGFVCDYCGCVHVPEANSDGVRVLGVPAAESCPVCSVPLIHSAIAGHRILYCTECRGMLINMNELLVIEQDLRARREATLMEAHHPDPRDLDRRIACPKCGGRMDAHPYQGPGNVIIDSCENCQLDWLDYGELNWMVRAPDWQYKEN